MQLRNPDLHVHFRFWLTDLLKYRNAIEEARFACPLQVLAHRPPEIQNPDLHVHFRFWLTDLLKYRNDVKMQIEMCMQIFINISIMAMQVKKNYLQHKSNMNLGMGNSHICFAETLNVFRLLKPFATL